MQTASNLAQKAMGTEDLMISPEYMARPDGRTMQALTWFGTKDVRIIEVPAPAIIQEDDVIVRVTGTSLSGSDLHLYRGEVMALKKKDILGHEFMGIVDEVGKQVQNVKPGQRVVASFQIACGKCEYCEQNLSSFCEKMNSSAAQDYMYGQREAARFGYSHFSGGFPGGQAEYVRVPKGDVNLLPIPDDVPDEKALYLSELIPTGYHAVVDTGVKEGNVVGIWGAGPVGLCTARWAFVKGASRVIMIDSVQDRLDFAHETLKVDIINFKTHANVPNSIYELVPRGLDIAIDCGTFHEPKTLIHKVQKTLMLETDVPETINEMLVSVRKVGRCGITATYVGYANGVNVGALMEKGVRLIGNGQAPVHLYWGKILHEYIIPGKFDPTFMITHRVPLEDLPRLYQLYDERKGRIEKVFVETKFANPPSAGTPKLTRVADWDV